MAILRVLQCTFLFAACLVSHGTASAHFPFLASDDQGHVQMWFGETTDDRTYPMPESVQLIQLHHAGDEAPIATEPIDSNSLVGLRSEMPINSTREIVGTVTYGLYHGTKLTYHVEHLPQSDPTSWPVQPRPNAAMQTVIRPVTDGGVSVRVLKNGNALPDTDVKLMCEDGHEEASKKTDAEGQVAFSSDEVESGLNALMIGYVDPSGVGVYEGQDHASTTHYLTATFRIGASQRSDEMPKKNKPTVDPASKVSIAPASFPELPEELTSFGSAVAGGKLYVYGGHTGGAHSYSTAEQSDRFWSLDLTAGKDAVWKTLATGPKLQGLALVPAGERVVRVGGFTALNAEGEEQDLRSQTSVAIYEPQNDAWTDLAPLPEPRSSLDAAVINDTVYVVGGWGLSGKNDESVWYSTAWSLDLSDSKAVWKRIADSPIERRANSVAAFGGKLYVLGGMQSEGGPTTRVDVYDPVTNRWTGAAAIPGAGMSGFGSSAFAIGSELYVSTMDGFVHRLGSREGAWTTVAKIDPARFFHRMVPHGDNALLMIGGANMEVGKFTQIDEIRVR